MAAAETWAIVLAGGDGARLRSLVRHRCGHDLPKQFAKLTGERSLLQVTLARMAHLIAPERTVVVVGAKHEAAAREQIGEDSGVRLVLQPCNLGTAPGILLPLAHVRARAPEATVVIAPSDHHVREERLLLAGIESALVTSRVHGLPVLVGAEAIRPETEYGWILPGHDADPISAPVRRFVEKPDRGRAERLLRQGALWNTFLVAGRAEDVWQMTRHRMPFTVGCFDEYARQIDDLGEPQLRERLYERLGEGDFSRDVLEGTAGLRVVPVRGSGWSDLGTPRRLFEVLHGGPATERFGNAGAHPAR